MARGNSINFCIGKIPKFRVLGNLKWLWEGGWMWVCAAGISDEIRSCIDLSEFAANVYICYRMNWHSAGKQLITQTAGSQRQHQPAVDDDTCLIACAQCSVLLILPCIYTMGMAHGKPITIRYVMLVNSFATNAVKTIQIYSWWYEEITMIQPVQKNPDPPHVYILVVNWLFQYLFSTLTLCTRLSKRLLALVWEWESTGRYQSALLLDFDSSHQQRFGKS